MERKPLNILRRSIAFAAVYAAGAFLVTPPTEVLAQIPLSDQKPSASPTPLIEFSIPSSIETVRALSTSKPIPINTVFRPMPEARRPEFQCPGEIVKFTFYGPTGNPTASGEPYSENAARMAIPGDPKKRKFGEDLGDKVKVTDPETLRSIEVIINDTGYMQEQGYEDYYGDLPQGTAAELNLTKRGHAMFCMEVIERGVIDYSK